MCWFEFKKKEGMEVTSLNGVTRQIESWRGGGRKGEVLDTQKRPHLFLCLCPRAATSVRGASVLGRNRSKLHLTYKTGKPARPSRVGQRHAHLLGFTRSKHNCRNSLLKKKGRSNRIPKNGKKISEISTPGPQTYSLNCATP